jgi:ribosomal protein S18 acetylase RimI-like enzyme
MGMMNNITIRTIKPSEYQHLETFLYEAIFIPEGQEKPVRDIIRLPELALYIKDFGRKGDICYVAEVDGKLTGAVWTRIFTDPEHGYGFIDADTPELSMSVLKDYRQKGIGANLLQAIIDALSKNGYRQVSLSVDRQNFALYIYEKSGFEVIKSSPTSVKMMKKLL